MRQQTKLASVVRRRGAAFLRRYACGYRAFQGIDLRQTDLGGEEIIGCDLTDADLTAADLSGAKLGRSALADEGSPSEESMLREAHAYLFHRTILRGARMASVDASGAELRLADLRGADLSGAKLARVNADNVDASGVDLTGADLWQADFSHADMAGAVLQGANLCDCNLEDANLEGADLRDADLQGAVFKGARLTNANLQSADLRGANLSGANLSNAQLELANLAGANLTSAVLSDAKFDGALLGSALIDVDLKPLCRVDVVHVANSTVDYRSILRTVSEPRLRELLLKFGMPAVFADYMIDCARSLTPQEVFSLLRSTFISYGRPDEAFAQRLSEALQREGVSTFFFRKHAPPGARLHRLIRDNVNSHDRVILICSQTSLERYGLVNELEETLAREARDGGETYLLPIRIDDYVLEEWRPKRADLATVVRDRVIADFTNHLDPKSFRESVTRLLSALRRPVVAFF